MEHITVGRNADCDIVIEDESISRLHARIGLEDEEHIWVSDNDSRNGTFLCRAGKWIRVRRVQLRDRDRIRFGDRELERKLILASLARRGFVVSGRLSGATGQNRPDRHRTVLEKPRRNPETGALEETENASRRNDT